MNIDLHDYTIRNQNYRFAKEQLSNYDGYPDAVRFGSFGNVHN